MKNSTSHTMKYIVILFISFLVIAHAHAQSVTVSQLPAGTICSGTSVEFTANPSGFPGQIYYQWYLNGTAIPGANSVNYTTSTLNNGDQIYVQCGNSTVGDMVPGSEFYYDATNPNSYRGGSATVKDLSGNGRDGTVQNFIAQGNPNASWSATDGGVFNLNGTGQHITTGWKPSNTMSFQIAFRSLEDYGQSWNRGLVSTFPLRSSPYFGFYIGTQHQYKTDAVLQNGLHYYYDDNSYGSIGVKNETINSTSTWYVLTVVSNPADNGGKGSIKFYLNGSATPLPKTASRDIEKTTHAGNIVIGRTGYDTDFWKGYIANVIVYDRILSTQEIFANYSATINRVTGASSASVISTVTNSIVLTSAAGTNNQSICNSGAITNIKYATTGVTNAAVTGLPNGVQGTWNNNEVTISGTPTQTGTFTYTVTLVGGCNPTTAQGTLNVNSTNNTITLTSAAGTDSQSSCTNATIRNITYATTGASDATVTGLPAGVRGEWNNGVVTISGTPVPTSGTFTYTVTLTGGCGTITRTGSITINFGSLPTVAITLTGDGVVGSGTTLSATTGFASYAWFLNGSQITVESTNNTYTPTAAGNYYVQVSNGTCYGTSSDVTIYAAPTVTINSRGDGCVNRTTLRSNENFVSYAWFLNGTEISNTNSKTYKPTAAGSYYVRVFNGAGYGNSSAVTIDVCGITKTGQMSTTTNLINTLGGAATPPVKLDERGKINN